MQQRLAWRDSLIHLRTHVTNQHHALLREAVRVDAVVAGQTALIAHLTRQIKGVERELNKVKLDMSGPQTLAWLNDQSRDSDSAQWVLWVDDQYRVIKMTVAGSNVEIVRD